MTKNEIRGFTGIRAIALWGVILYHLYPHIIKGGYLGVVIFFCLSGYLLMYQHLSRGNREPLHKFAKQYKKLTPPLLLTVTLTVLISAIFFSPDFRDVLASGVAAIFGVNNWQQILRGFSYFDLHGKFLPFTHFWALSAQLQFYLIWAILRKLFGDEPVKFAVSLAVLGAISLVLMPAMTPFADDTTRIYYGTDTRFFSFAIGALFGMASYQGSLNKPQTDKSLHVVALLAVVLVAFVVFREGAFLYYGGMLLFTILTCLLLAFTAKDDNAAARALDNPVLRYFGLRSYELYLWQYPVMLVFQQIFSHSTLSYHTVVLLQLPVLLLFAEATYRLFRYDAKDVLTRAATVCLLAVGIIGLIAIEPEAGDALPEDTAQSEDTLPGEDAAEETLEEGVAGELPEGVRAVNEEWPELALSTKDLERLKDLDGIMIGDSITEMTAPNVQELLPKFIVNGKKNRQMVHAKEILSSYDLTALPAEAPIVFQLGTNSDFNSKVLDELLAMCDGHEVYLMNTSIPDPWEDSVNEKFKDAAAASPHVHLIDWYGIAKQHEELFIADHTHPKDLGIDLFAQTVAKHVLPKEKKTKSKTDKIEKAPHKAAKASRSEKQS
ncbi:MAG: acyltransferase family protein [Peptoniphilus sp.]|nr:acyltransferase family protein [Peptoniphilus sp.]MDD7363154.1 acyltransferase family protein [Bacillota bacterium]MDY6044522.1 acyltransferase family protein [Peptoniphilus sp.]